MLASVVTTYAINLTELATDPDANSQIQKIQDLNDQLLNQTSSLLDQLPDSYNSTQTTPSP